MHSRPFTQHIALHVLGRVAFVSGNATAAELRMVPEDIAALSFEANSFPTVDAAMAISKTVKSVIFNVSDISSIPRMVIDLLPPHLRVYNVTTLIRGATLPCPSMMFRPENEVIENKRPAEDGSPNLQRSKRFHMWPTQVEPRAQEPDQPDVVNRMQI